MARITTRRPKEDEEDMIEGEGDDQEEQTSAPPVSDRRRRRQAKRGELPETPNVAATSVEPARKDRPTPSQRQEVTRSSNFVVRIFQDIVEYLKDTRSELQKVTWLSREDTMRLTYIVLIVTAVSAAVLGFVSFLFGLLTQAIATASSTTIAGAITIGLIVVVGGIWLFRERLFGGRFE